MNIGRDIGYIHTKTRLNIMDMIAIILKLTLVASPGLQSHPK